MADIDGSEGLERFVQAQEGVYEQALREIRGGQKQSHWMWFVFPQLEGLGFSSMSQRYAVRGRVEADLYLGHPVLGPRLVEICQAVLACEGRSAHDIFDSPDDMKLRSCATLFAQVAGPASVFARILGAFFEGRRDQRTLKLLAAAPEIGNEGMGPRGGVGM